jgi:hypothetical protein
MPKVEYVRPAPTIASNAVAPNLEIAMLEDVLLVISNQPDFIHV